MLLPTAAFLLLSTPAAAEPRVLTLQDAVALAKRHAFASRISGFREAAADAGVAEARIAFLPDVSGRVSGNAYQQSINPDYVFAGTIGSGDLRGDSWDADASASYVLLSSTRRLDLAAAKLRRESEAADNDAAKRAVVRDTARAYLQVVGADGRLRLAEQDVARRRRHLEEARALVKAGKRAEFEVIAAEAELATAEATLVETKNAARIARSALAQTVGTELPLDFIAELPPAPQDARSGRDVPAVVGDALKRRGELRSVEADAAAARIAYERANRHYLPTLSLYANYNRVLDVSERDAFDETISYGGQLQVRFSDMLSNRYRAKASHAESRLANVVADQTRVAISLEVERAVLETDRAVEVLAATEKSLDASRRNYESATERYRLGVATQTERLDAESALVKAEVDAANSRFNYHTALWNLRYEMGEPLD